MAGFAIQGPHNLTRRGADCTSLVLNDNGESRPDLKNLGGTFF